MKFHTILPDLVPIIPFTLPLYYDMLLVSKDYIGNLVGHSENLRAMMLLGSPSLSMNAGEGVHWDLTAQFCGSMQSLIGGLLPLAPKSSCQTLRICPCGLLRYPHKGLKLIFEKRGMMYKN
jgi:hypothetical protein